MASISLQNPNVCRRTFAHEFFSSAFSQFQANRSYHIDSSATLNGTQSPPVAEKPLASMTLSSDPIVNATDLVNVTKVRSQFYRRKNNFRFYTEAMPFSKSLLFN